MLRWYEWGSEKPGNVSIWILTPNREVKSLGELAKIDLPHKSIYDCPYS